MRTSFEALIAPRPLPVPGDVRTVYGQRYVLTATEPRSTRRGVAYTLVWVSSRCPDCGAPFRFGVTLTRWRRDPGRRRCDACANPGEPSPGRIAHARRVAERAAERERRARLWKLAGEVHDLAGCTQREAFDYFLSKDTR